MPLRPILVWLILIVSTLASWSFGHSYGLPIAYAAIAIIIISMVKVYLIVMEFMELREAHPAARFVTIAWLTGLGGGLIYFYAQ